MRRGALRTLHVSVATLVCVIAGAFALQAVVLGRADSARLILAGVVGKLYAFHEARTRIALAGAPRHSLCLQHWHSHLRVAAVWFSDGTTLREVGVKLEETGKRALDEFVLAGCPRPLADWIGTQLDRGRPILLQKARLGRIPVYDVRFRDTGFGLELSVNRADSLPVRLALRGVGVLGTSWPVYGTPRPHPSWWAV